MESLLLKLAPTAGAAVAVIVVVILFLKFLEKWMGTLRLISDSCHATTKETREAYQKHITAMEDRDEERRKELAHQYEIDRRETLEVLEGVRDVLRDNGGTLRNIETQLIKGVHPLIREQDFPKGRGA